MLGTILGTTPGPRDSALVLMVPTFQRNQIVNKLNYVVTKKHHLNGNKYQESVKQENEVESNGKKGWTIWGSLPEFGTFKKQEY